MKKFEKVIEVRWSDIDQNRHVRHSAYYDYGAHTRIRFFTEQELIPQVLEKMNVGPVIFKEECTFLKELYPGETITVNLLLGEHTDDLRKYELHHEIFNSKGEKAAHITLSGSWLDLAKRKLTLPPEEIIEMFQSLPKGERFVFNK